MTDQAMIERVARALARANFPPASDRDIDDMWDGWVVEAETAIKAMREPTTAMIEAGEAVDGTVSAAPVWAAMIDAALKGEG